MLFGVRMDLMERHFADGWHDPCLDLSVYFSEDGSNSNDIARSKASSITARSNPP